MTLRAIGHSAEEHLSYREQREIEEARQDGEKAAHEAFGDFARLLREAKNNRLIDTEVSDG